MTSAQSKGFWAAKSELLPVIAVSVLLVAFWLPLLHHLSVKRQDDLAQARKDVTNISAAISEHVSRLVVGVDQLMRLIQEDYRRDPTAFVLQNWIVRSTSLDDVAKAINVFDEHGFLIASSLPGRVGLNPPSILDRAEFQILATQRDSGLIIGRTYPGRVSSGMIFPLFRRLEDRFGHFKGVLSVSLDPDYLVRHFASLDTGVDGSLALFGRDGFVRARSPVIAGMYERNFLALSSRADVFSALKTSRSGNYRLRSVFDGKMRIFGYRAVGDLPLVLSVGRSEIEVLASYRYEARLALSFGVIASGAILTLSILIIREANRRAAREKALAEAHAALAEAEGSFRGIFESSPELIYVHRIALDGTIIVERFNPAAAAVACVDETSLGKPLQAILPSAVFEQASAAIAEVVATGKTLRRQSDVKAENAEREIVIVPLRGHDPHGRIERVFVSIRDISHLRLAQEAVAVSEARYRMLAETTSDMVTRLSLPTFTREYVSPACRSLIGYEPEEMLGRTPAAEMHPEDEPFVTLLVEDLVSGVCTDPILTVTYRVRHKRGHWLWVETCMNLVRRTDGTPEALVCSVRDIDERRRAETAQAASDARFRLLAENTSELIILAYEDGRRSYISPASERMLGYTPEQLDEEMRSGRWLHVDDVAILAGATLHGGQDASFSCRVRRRDGLWIWVEAIVRHIRDAQEGEPTVIATLRDVSERHAQAEALKQAKEAAEEASQAKSDFLATMSHEIRTPLNGILGYAELLERSPLDVDGRRHLSRIRNAGSALRTVVDDILDFSKMEAGYVGLRLEPFEPGGLVDNATSIVHGLAQDKGLDLIVRLDSVLPANLVGDHDRLRQVLLNLLNNAIKFTSTGSITLSVNSRMVGNGSASLRFTISDTGIGIPEDKHARLFERFSQVDGSISREYGGTGLGLAICRSLVEAMGGKIGVYSEAARGSDFWFEVVLPLSWANVKLLSPPTPSASNVTTRPLRILLADDQELNQELTRAILEAEGHVVKVVADGAAAVASVADGKYDVVLMDIQMPVMDGLEATRRIRMSDEPSAQIPIVALTANVLPVQIDLFLRAGMNSHLGKPFRRADLLATLQDIYREGQLTTSWQQDTMVFDKCLFDDLASAIGQDPARRLLNSALSQVALLVKVEAPDNQRLQSAAHAAISAAGSLGLTEISFELRELERTCKAGECTAGQISIIATALSRARSLVASTICQPATLPGVGTNTLIAC